MLSAVLLIAIHAEYYSVGNYAESPLRRCYYSHHYNIQHNVAQDNDIQKSDIKMQYSA